MSNPCLDAVTDELERAGVRYRVDHGGKHLHVHYGEDYRHVYVTALTPSDTRRGPLNARSDIRRHLKELGLVAAEVELLAPERAAVQLVDGTPSCFSYDIAASFGKEHKDVLRTIDRVREECGSEFDQRNFAPVDYLDPKGRKYRAYRLTRDGFSLIVMGFTGATAMSWKVRYIAAFNALTDEISRLATVPAGLGDLRADLDALVGMIGDVEAKASMRAPIVAAPAPSPTRSQRRRELRRMIYRSGWRFAG